MMSAGVGPSVDYRVIKGGQSNKLVFGARPEIGLSYFLSNRISLYFTVAYLKGFSGVESMMQADSSDKTFYNNSLLFTIGIGYRVKKEENQLLALFQPIKTMKVSEKAAFFFCYAARLLSIFIFKISLVFSIITFREVILQK